MSSAPLQSWSIPSPQTSGAPGKMVASVASQSPHESTAPSPSTSSGTRITRLQEFTVPVSPPAVSSTVRIQSPSGASPSKSESEPSGTKVPLKGAIAAPIGVVPSSSNVVTW